MRRGTAEKLTSISKLYKKRNLHVLLSVINYNYRPLSGRSGKKGGETDMCVAVPLKIREIHGSEAEAEAFGASRTIRVDLVPGVQAGDFVIVHAGIAIAKIQETEAEESLNIIRDVIEAEASGDVLYPCARKNENKEEKHAPGV
jgi:hydrogenase expression/formation protein HypC